MSPKKWKVGDTAYVWYSWGKIPCLRFVKITGLTADSAIVQDADFDIAEYEGQLHTLFIEQLSETAEEALDHTTQFYIDTPM